VRYQIFYITLHYITTESRLIPVEAATATTKFTDAEVQLLRRWSKQRTKPRVVYVRTMVWRDLIKVEQWTQPCQTRVCCRHGSFYAQQKESCPLRRVFFYLWKKIY